MPEPREPANDLLLEAVLFHGTYRPPCGGPWTLIVDLSSQRGLRQARYELDALVERLAAEVKPPLDPLECHLLLTSPAGGRLALRWRLRT